MSHPLVLTGTPQIVDSFLRPVVRGLVVGGGALAFVILLWFGLMWWAPLPLALGLIGHELFFWWRGDRAQTLRIEGSTLILDDPLAAGVRAVDLGAITVATAFWRPLPGGELELAVVLGDDEDVRFAVRVLQRVPFLPGSHDVPAEVIDLLLGGIAGLFRALAPDVLRPRQTFVDPEGALIARLREAVPARAWRRTGLRLWEGMEPAIDLFGYYEGPHAGWLVLDQHDWTCGARSGSIRGWSFGSAERTAVLFQGMERHTVSRLPLALIHLGGLSVAVPAPAAPGFAPEQPLSSDLQHTHAPEGAALLWHLLVHTPRDARPPELAEMIADRRPLRPDLEHLLPG